MGYLVWWHSNSQIKKLSRRRGEEESVHIFLTSCSFSPSFKVVFFNQQIGKFSHQLIIIHSIPAWYHSTNLISSSSASSFLSLPLTFPLTFPFTFFLYLSPYSIFPFTFPLFFLLSRFISRAFPLSFPFKIHHFISPSTYPL